MHNSYRSFDGKIKFSQENVKICQEQWTLWTESLTLTGGHRGTVTQRANKQHSTHSRQHAVRFRHHAGSSGFLLSSTRVLCQFKAILTNHGGPRKLDGASLDLYDIDRSIVTGCSNCHSVARLAPMEVDRPWANDSASSTWSCCFCVVRPALSACSFVACVW